MDVSRNEQSHISVTTSVFMALVLLYLPHLMPYRLGQAPCNELSDRSPLVSKLYQKAMEPLFGNVARPWLGKAVAPPSKSESCGDVIIEIMLSG